MKDISATSAWRALRTLLLRLHEDQRGMAAIEFAFIVPLMLMLIFGTIQVSNGVAVDRKVTLTARTLSDLVSQNSTVTDTDISNSIKLGQAILTPYPGAPLQAKISQLYIDPIGLVAKVKWSKATPNTTAHTCNEVVVVPAGLKVAGTYLIWSEVTYNYTPVAGYNINTGFGSAQFALTDQTYTRPRQSEKVAYPTAPACI